MLLGQSQEQCLLVRKVFIERPDAYAGRGGDPIGGDGETLALENPSSRAVALSPLELRWKQWLDAGGTGSAPPPLPPTSPLMPQLLRKLLAPAREAACQKDETMNRLLGILPSPAAAWS